ncbi:MAG TPA: MerR family transcriptional regulator [Terriglobales bacterium]|nr:MerR family transcriptional regulator [Terriglobales bacterium]
MPRPPRFTIRAASALTGINQNTLRAWERRHGLVQPERTPKGYRLYSDQDVDRLRRIQHALAEGVPISRVRAWLESHDGHGPSEPRAPDSSLARAGVNAPPAVAVAGGPSTIRIPAVAGAHVPPSLASLAEEIERAVASFDRVKLEKTFARAVGLHGLRAAFHAALAPALSRLGLRARENPEASAALTFLRAFAHEKLASAHAGLRPLHQPARVIFGSLPGDHDELPSMLLSLEVGLQGVSVLHVEAGRPVEAIVRAARKARSSAVALSAATAAPQEPVLDLRDRLAAQPQRPRLLLAGDAARAQRVWLESRGIGVLAEDVPCAAGQVLLAIGRS